METDLFVSLFFIPISGSHLTQRRFSVGGPWLFVHLNTTDGRVITCRGSIVALRRNHNPRVAFSNDAGL